ncbi:hypothetical protein [Nonomuraea gerenzanensis]|uniref:Integral membrane protein n=1 Tax=Nonomuraea gerenzanensis TaxID=93944 RepID=A0A1M4EFT3_9ACTN|nr:hypothetical protein [Nonomuraea gerenzanensis]UBU09279.1 hypothetical protein LCN96_33505 [Nonomuraea gerenzanensis]SBO97680.1 hypothetical protein BN4615_P7196 [Nonomuraea gerenzanensis]
MNPLVRGVIVTAAAILPGRARRERYLEQWLADGEGAAEAGMGSLAVALGALRAALAMNLTRRSAVPLALAAVLVIGGARLATTSSSQVLGIAIAMAGVALPLLLLVLRRFTERDTLGDWEDTLAARQAGLSRGRPADRGAAGKRLLPLLLGAAPVILAAVLLLVLFR